MLIIDAIEMAKSVFDWEITRNLVVNSGETAN
jgi:hypothetical protein